jgi:hypothetical protein
MMAVTDNPINNVNVMLNLNFYHQLQTLRSFVSKTRNSSKQMQEFKNLCQLLKVEFSKPKIDVIIECLDLAKMIRKSFKISK